MQTRGIAVRGMVAQGPGRGRVRAFTSEDAEARVARHVTGLAVFLARPDALARALRAMRKAAVRGGTSYDPAYHAALLRLARAGGAGGGAVMPLRRKVGEATREAPACGPDEVVRAVPVGAKR